MKNFLVKMSRNRRIMVPAVTLLALSIGIGGYYVDNQKVLREEASQNQQNLDIQEENARLKKEQKVNQKDQSNDSEKKDSSNDSEQNSSTTAIQYVVTIDASEENNKVVVKAKIEGSEPGECFITLKQGSYGPEESVETLGENCEVTFDKPAPGEWNISVVYTSSDSKQTGSGTSTIQL